MVFDQKRTLGITVGKRRAEEIARHAAEYAALPANSRQHPVLLLGSADLRGVVARVRPLVGNIGTVPAVDVGDSGNRGDFARFRPGSIVERETGYEQANPLTDAHMDIDSVREGTVVICPVKVEGGGVYVGDVHAMQGQGEIAGHTTDVSAEVTLVVEIIKGLTLDGPILLPQLEDLPFLARPFTQDELNRAAQMAREWDVELEQVAPIQVVGSGQNLNAAVHKALQRASELLSMSLSEVRNRATVTGSIEIGHSGMVRASILAPVRQLAKLGILDLIREQYGL
jgi:acetamidase/formamidase